MVLRNPAVEYNVVPFSELSFAECTLAGKASTASNSANIMSSC